MIIADIFGLLATVLWVGFAVFFVLMLRPLLSLLRTVTPGQTGEPAGCSSVVCGVAGP